MIEQIDSLVNREREKESLRDDEGTYPCDRCGTECEYDELKKGYAYRLFCEDCYDDLEG